MKLTTLPPASEEVKNCGAVLTLSWFFVMVLDQLSTRKTLSLYVADFAFLLEDKCHVSIFSNPLWQCSQIHFSFK
jgi:hypothetical protein